MEQINVPSHSGGSAITVLQEYWRIGLRRKWILLGAVALSLAAAIVYCKLATKMYRSDTLILLEDQKIPENYVQGASEAHSNFERRIFVIESQVRSRSLLEKVRDDLDLYAEEVKKFGREWAVLRMNGSLLVTAVNKGTVAGLNNIGAFTISFADEDPATAMNVTSRIAAMLIEENLKDRTLAAEGTTEFLDNEVNRTKVHLDKKEEEISRFKSQHAGELPQQNETNQRVFDRLDNDLKTVNESIQRQTDRLALVGKAIEQYLQYGVTIPTLVNGTIQANPALARLSELKAKLVELEAEFWEGYPEVIVTKEEIRQLEQKLRKQYGPDAVKTDEQTIDPYFQDLKKQQTEIKSELALLTQRQRMIRAEKKTYEDRLDTAPAVEQQLLTLMRDYENLKSNYQSLVDKRLHALVAENLEKRQKGAQLKILDPAKFPRVPEKPNSLRIVALGLIFGCSLGVGIVVLLEQLNPQFRRPEDIESVFGPQLLAVIPDFSLEYAYKNWKRFLPYHFNHSHNTDGNGNGAPLSVELVATNGSKGASYQRGFVVRWLPNTLVSEQYRVAGTRLSLLGMKQQSKVIAVTSAVKGEGKTTTVINLGYTMARDMGKRVMLIDCDFKCPGLHPFMEQTPQWGLADYLTTDLDIDSCLSGFGEVPCWIMPVGNPVVQETALLKTDRLTGLLEQLRSRFDYIFINTPPILPQATMNVLAGHADHLILIVRANSTPHDVVRRAVSSLRSNKPTHVILNAVGSQSLPSYIYEYAPLQPSQSRTI